MGVSLSSSKDKLDLPARPLLFILDTTLSPISSSRTVGLPHHFGSPRWAVQFVSNSDKPASLFLSLLTLGSKLPEPLPHQLGQVHFSTKNRCVLARTFQKPYISALQSLQRYLWIHYTKACLSAMPVQPTLRRMQQRAISNLTRQDTAKPPLLCFKLSKAQDASETTKIFDGYSD